MNQLIIRLCVVIGLLYLGGCSGDIVSLGEEGSKGNNIEKSNGVSERDTYEIKDLVMLINSDSSRKYVNTENGYYYMTEEAVELQEGSYGHHLFYVDFKTKQEVHLCNDSSCQHDTETCTAVLPEDEFEYDSNLFVYQNKLYILSRPYDDDGSSSVTIVGDKSHFESQPAVLYRMDLDGRNREIVYRFDPDVTVESSVFADGNGLYLVTKKLASKQEGAVNFTTSSEREMVRIDTSTWKAQAVVDMDLDDGDTKWEIIGSYGNQLIVKGIIFETALSLEDERDHDKFLQAYEKSKTIIASVDLLSGNMKEWESFSNKSHHTVAVEKGILYLSLEENDEIIKHNFMTGEREVLANIEQNFIFEVFDGKLSMSSWDFTDHGMHFVDMETGEISKSDLVTRTLGWRLEVRGETESHILAVYDYDAEARQDDAFEINQYKFALIKKSDFYKGIDNFEPIQMIGKGI